MSENERLADLLLLWEERFQQGEDIPPEELCRDCPELAPALAADIRGLRKLAWMNKPVEGAETGDELLSSEGVQPCVPPAACSPGTLAGRYRLDRLIAEGGCGRVWQGFDLELQRNVAVKLPKTSRLTDSVAVEGFLLEARKVAALKHKGIVPVYDVDRHEGVYFIVSELIDGTDLRARQSREALSCREAVRVVARAARHLHQAHCQGLIHRDVKPSNLLLDETGEVYLTDFGIAVTEDEVRQQRADRSGTLAYMSPEQLSGDPSRIDAGTDIYSLGVLLYELLTGEVPFHAESPEAVREGILLREPRPPRSLNIRIPKAIERACLKCLAKDRALRYPTGEALANDLEGWLNRRPFRYLAEKSALWIGGVCGLLGLGLALILFLGQPGADSVGRKRIPQHSLPPPADPPRMREVRRFDGHAGAILQVAFTADGRLALSAGRDAIRLWEVVSGKQLEPVAVASRGAEFQAVAISPDGKRVLAYGWPSPRKDDFTPPSDPGGLRLWDVETGRLIHREWRKAPFEDVCLAFSFDGRRFLYGWDAPRAPGGMPHPGKRLSYSLRIRDTETFRELTGNGNWAHLPPGSSGIPAVSFAPNGRMFLVGGDFGNGDLRIRLYGSGIPRHFEGHTKAVSALAFFADSRRFVSGGGDKTIRIWDVDAGKQVKHLPGHSDAVQGLAVSPSGKRLLSAGRDSTVRLWNLESDEEVHCFTGHTGRVRSVAFSPDGRYALSGDEDGVLRLLQMPPEGTPERSLPKGQGEDNKKDGVTQKAPPAGGDMLRPLRRFEGHTGAIHGVAFWPNGKLAVSGGVDAVRLWDVASGKQLRLVRSSCRCVAFSPDGKRVLTYGRGDPRNKKQPGVFRLLSVEEDREISRWGDPQLERACVAFSPTGHLLLYSIERVVQSGMSEQAHCYFVIGDGDTGKLARGVNYFRILAKEGYQGIRTAVFSPDGEKIVVGGGYGTNDYTIRLAILVEGEVTPYCKGHTGVVLALAFLPGGSRLLSAGNDKTIRMWDMATGKEVKRFTGHTDAVNAIAVSPTGRRLLSAGSDGTVRLWDTQTGDELGCFTSQARRVLSVVFAPDGRSGLIGDETGGLTLVAVPAENPVEPQRK